MGVEFNNVSQNFNSVLKNAGADKIITRDEVNQLRQAAQTDDDRAIVALVSVDKRSVNFNVNEGASESNYALDIDHDEELSTGSTDAAVDSSKPENTEVFGPPKPENKTAEPKTNNPAKTIKVKQAGSAGVSPSGGYKYDSPFAKEIFAKSINPEQQKNSDINVVNKGNAAHAYIDYKSPEKTAMVKQMQKDLGVNQDGHVGAETMNKLLANLAIASAHGDTQEVEKLNGYIKDLGLDTIFAGTPVAKTLADIQGAGSTKAPDNKAGEDKTTAETTKAGKYVQDAGNALSATPYNFSEFNKLREEVKTSDLTPEVKEKTLEKFSDLAGKKLAENIVSNLTAEKPGPFPGPALIDSIGEKPVSAKLTKEVFGLLYDKKVVDGNTIFEPKANPDQKALAACMAKPEFKELSPGLQGIVFGKATKGMDVHQLVKQLFSFDVQTSANILASMAPKEAAKLLTPPGGMADHAAAERLKKMAPETATAILAEMPADAAKAVKATVQFSAKP